MLEISTREIHALTCKGETKPTPSSEVLKGLERPLERGKGTENPSGVSKILSARGCPWANQKRVSENLHARRFSTREMSTRETHAFTCEEGPQPAPSPEASKRLEGPLDRGKGTENLAVVPKGPCDQTKAGLGVQTAWEYGKT